MNIYDITALEDAIRGIVKNAGVATKVFANRPESTEHSEHFAVVKMSSDLEDMLTYGDCTLSVTLFAKDNQGEKNGKRLQWMQSLLVNAMPVENGKFVFDADYTILPDVPDNYGYHARTIVFDLTIKL